MYLPVTKFSPHTYTYYTSGRVLRHKNVKQRLFRFLFLGIRQNGCHTAFYPLVSQFGALHLLTIIVYSLIQLCSVACFATHCFFVISRSKISCFCYVINTMTRCSCSMQYLNNRILYIYIYIYIYTYISDCFNFNYPPPGLWVF